MIVINTMSKIVAMLLLLLLLFFFFFIAVTYSLSGFSLTFNPLLFVLVNTGIPFTICARNPSVTILDNI